MMATALYFAQRYWKQIAIVIVILSVFAWHKAKVHQAYKAGRQSVISEQAKLAKEKSNAAAKNRSDIERCGDDPKCLRAKDANQRD